MGTDFFFLVRIPVQNPNWYDKLLELDFTSIHGTLSLAAAESPADEFNGAPIGALLLFDWTEENHP